MFLINVFVSLILLADTVFADLNQGEPRIVLGTPAQLGQFPYQVSIQRSNFTFCGGSLIDTKHVVTAAHCVEKKNLKIQVWSGNLRLYNGGIYKPVKNIFIHEKYKTTKNIHDYDIAVLRLESPFSFNNITNLIALPSGNISEGTNCIVSGWGDIKSNQINKSGKLLYAPVRTSNWQNCSSKYASLTKNMICAGDDFGHDACQGDSGGPLACKLSPTENSTSLVGIVSFGLGCGEPYYPGVYTNVYQFVNWIKKQQTRNSAIYLYLDGTHRLAILIASILYAILF